jgi:hypothetical protein
MGRGWKNSEVQVRKVPHGTDELTVILVRVQEKKSYLGSASMVLEITHMAVDQCWWKKDGRDHSDETSDRNEESYWIWRKGRSYYKTARNLAELSSYPIALWKVILQATKLVFGRSSF